MARGRRRARAEQGAVPSSPSADELAVHAAEGIVGRAWAEQLLRYYDRMDHAFHAAREECEAAAGSLIAAQRYGDPGEISLAHVALEHALEACRASEAAREQGRLALQTALEALVRIDEERAYSEQALPQNIDSTPTTAPAATSRPTIRLALPAGGAPEVVRRALWRFGRLRARRAADSEQP